MPAPHSGRSGSHMRSARQAESKAHGEGMLDWHGTVSREGVGARTESKRVWEEGGAYKSGCGNTGWGQMVGHRRGKRPERGNSLQVPRRTEGRKWGGHPRASHLPLIWGSSIPSTDSKAEPEAKRAQAGGTETLGPESTPPPPARLCQLPWVARPSQLPSSQVHFGLRREETNGQVDCVTRSYSLRVGLLKSQIPNRGQTEKGRQRGKQNRPQTQPPTPGRKAQPSHPANRTPSRRAPLQYGLPQSPAFPALPSPDLSRPGSGSCKCRSQEGRWGCGLGRAWRGFPPSCQRAAPAPRSVQPLPLPRSPSCQLPRPVRSPEHVCLCRPALGPEQQRHKRGTA